ncbi:replication-associated protein [Capybara virus 22_cap1_591]|nr:replication-associated protein [Capybara virus 22_cap1_591]
MFRVNSATLFLTYPQCPIPKEDAISILQTIFPQIKDYIVAEERHQNGDKHLHVYLKLEEKGNWKTTTFADLTYENITYHGNYQGCRSTKNVIKYCTKDENYISNLDVNEIICKRASHKRILAKHLIDKTKNLVEVVKENPELLFEYSKLKQNLIEFRRDELDVRQSLPDFLPNPLGWLLSSKISAKRRHFWIYSRQPNKGKTFHFAKPLSTLYKCLVQSGDYTYWNLSGQEDCLIMDEYNHASIKYSHLNAMADGTYGFRIFKGGLMQLPHLLLIVLSNQSIDDLYPIMTNLIKERFNEYEIL